MHAKLALSAAALLCAAAPSFAGSINYIGRAVGFARNATFTDKTSTQTAFSLTSESENAIGGHGYATTSFSFTGGTVRARNHACVGSGDGAYPGDQADATSEVFLPSQNLFVRSSTLPDGAQVAITICYSISATMSGELLNSNADNNFSRNSMSIRINEQPIVSAQQQAQNGWNGFTNSGDFAGQSGGTVTKAGSYTFNVRVNRSFSLRLSMSSHSQAFLESQPASAPNSVCQGTAGCAMTFGLGAITPGARLEWQGADWTGNCNPSLPLIPENPVPAPGAAAALAGLGAWATRRRRN
jgi:MYXO-CTERM domain-containing protein